MEKKRVKAEHFDKKFDRGESVLSELDLSKTTHPDRTKVKNMADGAAFVVMFCTGQIMKFDMAVNALKQAGIPHQTRTETSTGLKVAVSVTPGMGPGNYFTLLVPASAEPEAKLVLSELPFEVTTNPDSWDFQPRPTTKRWLKICILGVLALLLMSWIGNLTGLWR